MLDYTKPLNWTNISLGEYIELQHLTLDNPDKLDDEDIMLNQIQLLYGKNPYAMPIQEFRKCVEGLKFTSEKMPKMRMRDTYNLNGNTYHLHRKLNEFKVGQYIDFERIMKIKKGIEAYPDFIALFLTPDKEGSYGDGYDVQTVIDDVTNYMTAADADTIAAFFLRKSRLFIAASLIYSNRMAMRTVKDRKARRELKSTVRKLVRMTLDGGWSR